MSAILRNLISKVRRLPEAAVEIYRQFWARDRDTLIADLHYERQQLRDLIAKLQTRDLYLSAEIRRHEARRYMGIGA